MPFMNKASSRSGLWKWAADYVGIHMMAISERFVEYSSSGMFNLCMHDSTADRECHRPLQLGSSDQLLA